MVPYHHPEGHRQSFLFAIRLLGVPSRIKSDLNFSHANLTDGFRGFMRHAVLPPEAFQVLHLTLKLSRKTQKPRVGEHCTGSKNVRPTHASSPSAKNTRNPDNSPKGLKSFCLSPSCRKRAIRHLLDDCGQTRSEKKTNLRVEIAVKKAKDGSSRSTHQQESLATSCAQSSKSGSISAKGTTRS